MNLAVKCSLDLKDLLDKRELVDNEIKAFIKAKVLSGECDDTFIRIEEKHPMIPFLLLSSLKAQDTIVTEAYEDSEIHLLEQELLETITEVYDAEKANLVYNYLESHLELTPYEVIEVAYLHVPYSNGKIYYLEMMDDGLESEDYNASYHHSFKAEYEEYLYDYWMNLLKSRKDIIWEEIQKKLNSIAQYQDDELIF